MKALHINSYFLTNRIHYNLYKELLKRREDQFLIPVYKHFKNKNIPGVNIDYVFGKVDKTVFVTKIWKVIFLFYKKRFRDFDYIHGHTLMSDGIPVYIISKLQKKKYVISVRNTDLTLFIEGSRIFKYLGKVILNRAKAVFFISPSLQKKIEIIYPDIDRKKFFLLPNGLDPYWVDTEKNDRAAVNKEVMHLLFVGELIPRKNLDILLKFIQEYTDRKYVLNVVGENTDEIDFAKIKQKIPKDNELIYLGKITDKNKLRAVYDKSDIFVLLSHAETFGVVYIEAISRGLPIIFSRDEGLDGFFPDGHIGYASEKNSTKELKQKIDWIQNNYKRISSNAQKESGKFVWDVIVENYLRNICEVIKD